MKVGTGASFLGKLIHTVPRCGIVPTCQFHTNSKHILNRIDVNEVKVKKCQANSQHDDAKHR